MSFTQKDLILEYRKEGLPFREIAEKTHASEDYCRTVCSRANLHIEQKPTVPIDGVCKQCGKQLINTPGAKAKIYCSDKCRYEYYNKQKARKAYDLICKYCGKKFVAFGNPKKRFCSRDCQAAASRKE